MRFRLLVASTIALSACFVAIPARAATIVVGSVPGFSPVWDAAGSPYILQGDFVVPTSQILKVTGGVTILIAAPAPGAQPSKIYVDGGYLIIIGTAADPVLVSPELPGGAWEGVVVGYHGNAYAEHAVLSGAHVGFTAGSQGGFGLRSSTVTGCDTAAYGVTMSFDSVVLRGNTDAVVCVGFNVNACSFHMENSVVTGNKGGLYFPGAVSGTLLNSTIQGNDVGMVGPGQPYLIPPIPFEVVNTIVTGNAQIGISAPAGLLTVTSSDVWGNGTNFNGVGPGAGTISADPLFASASGNFPLSAASPCIDTAPTGSAPLLDIERLPRPFGPKSDMGASEWRIPKGCGDGILDASEGCDDGNTTSGDGCAADCVVEASSTSSGAGGASTTAGVGSSSGSSGSATAGAGGGASSSGSATAGAGGGASTGVATAGVGGGAGTGVATAGVGGGAGSGVATAGVGGGAGSASTGVATAGVGGGASSSGIATVGAGGGASGSVAVATVGAGGAASSGPVATVGVGGGASSGAAATVGAGGGASSAVATVGAGGGASSGAAVTVGVGGSLGSATATGGVIGSSGATVGVGGSGGDASVGVGGAGGGSAAVSIGGCGCNLEGSDVGGAGVGLWGLGLAVTAARRRRR